MEDQRCPYFALQVKRLPVSGLPHPLRVPIYECALSETLCTRLRSLPEGEALDARLEVTAPDGSRQCLYGPDLETLSLATCTPQRGTQRCVPAFVDLMTALGLDATLPERDAE